MHRNRPGVSRRDILRIALAGAGLGALGPLGRGLLPSAYGAPTSDDFAVVVNCYGGNDGLNTVIPIGLQPYYDRRNLGSPGSIAIPPGTELSLDVGPNPSTAYGLHPALASVRDLWADGDVAIVHKVGYPQANLSHFTSQDIYSLGVRGEFAPLGVPESGWIARFADLYAPTPLGAVSVGVGRPLDLEGGATNPFTVHDLTNFRFEEDPVYPDGHAHRLETIGGILDGYAATGLEAEVANALEQGHDLVGEIQAAVDAYASSVDYGADPLPDIARTLRDIAILVQYGFETRVFFTGLGGFDTHAAQGAATGNQAALLTRLDGALGAFARDMKAMGVWQKTAIVVVSEFGRRNYQNASGGTDHGHGNCFFILGGGVNGGVYGSDITEADLNGAYPPYAVDFRDVYRAVIDDHLGFDASPVFPEPQELITTLGIF